MSESPGRLDDLVAELERARDELALQAHLGKAEAKDEWEKLEQKWTELKRQLAPFEGAAKETAQNVGSALELAAEELKAGYKRFRDLL